MPEEEITKRKAGRISKYAKEIEQYSNETQSWLIDVFNTHKIKMDQDIIRALRNDIYFLLNNDAKHFERTSYNIYAKMCSKRNYSFLDEHSYQISVFIREYHKIASNNYRSSFSKYSIKLPAKIKVKINKVESECHINLVEWQKHMFMLFMVILIYGLYNIGYISIN